MKPFTDYIMEINRKYDFVIRIAECDMTDETKSRVKNSLAMYVVENMSAPKRLPIQEHRDFLGLGPCEVNLFEITLKYPTITPQIRQIIAENLGIGPNQVVVRTRLEEDQLDYHVRPEKSRDGSILNNTDLSAESGQDLVGNNRIENMLKELETLKHQFAQNIERVKTELMPQGTKSPVGSNQNKIPSPKGR